MEQMKNAIGDLKELIGKQLIPVYDYWAERIKKVIAFTGDLLKAIDKESANTGKTAKDRMAILEAERTAIQVRLKHYEKDGIIAKRLNAEKKQYDEQRLAMIDRTLIVLRNQAVEEIKLQKDTAKSGEILSEGQKQQRLLALREMQTEEAKLYAESIKLSRARADFSISKTLEETKAKRDAVILDSEAYKIYNDYVIQLETERQMKSIEFQNLMVGNFAGGIATMIDGSRSFSESVGDIWNNMKNQIINAISQMIAKWLVFQALTGFFGGGAGMFVGKLFGFDEGGVVPGVKGTPQLVMAHAGETILPTHKTGQGANIGGDVFNFDIKLFGSDKRHAEEVAGQIFSKVRRNKKV
jgi:hypothetical protein